MECLNKIIFLYIKSKHQALKLPENAKALLIIDLFKGLTTSAVNDLLKKNDIIAIYVINNHTNLFQPLDVSMNKSIKCPIAEKYQDWHAENVLQELKEVLQLMMLKVHSRV